MATKLIGALYPPSIKREMEVAKMAGALDGATATPETVQPVSWFSQFASTIGDVAKAGASIVSSIKGAGKTATPAQVVTASTGGPAKAAKTTAAAPATTGDFQKYLPYIAVGGAGLIGLMLVTRK
jgi:hypothetical protein